MNSGKRFRIVIEPDEPGFHAYVPALPGVHTFGDTIEEARANIAEAMALHIEAMLEENETEEDIRIAHQALAELKAAGGDRKQAGWLEWSEVEKMLN